MRIHATLLLACLAVAACAQQQTTPATAGAPAGTPAATERTGSPNFRAGAPANPETPIRHRMSGGG
jgi:hypothetical protein